MEATGQGDSLRKDQVRIDLERATFPRSGIFVVFRLTKVASNATSPCDTD